MPHTRTALVIGGGIAGPVAAMALRQADIEATVYEGHPSGAEGIGVFFMLASNGIDALRTIGADEPALAAGFPTPGITLRSTTGKNLGATRIGLPLADGTTSHTLKRADLSEAIRDEATSRGIAVEHGKRLASVEQTGDGMQAVFEDGSDAVGDAVIGADGIRSVVRGLIDPNAPTPTYGGLINVGGYARGVQVDADPGSFTMIFGKRAFFGYALAPSGDVWWFANVPRRDEPSRGEVEAVTADEWQRRLAELYAEDAGPAARLVQATDPIDISRASAIHSVPRLPVWHTDRMIVIGDAAHAPTPTSGQGASLAVGHGAARAAQRTAQHPALPQQQHPATAPGRPADPGARQAAATPTDRTRAPRRRPPSRQVHREHVRADHRYRHGDRRPRTPHRRPDRPPAGPVAHSRGRARPTRSRSQPPPRTWTG